MEALCSQNRKKVARTQIMSSTSALCLDDPIGRQADYRSVHRVSGLRTMFEEYTVACQEVL